MRGGWFGKLITHPLKVHALHRLVHSPHNGRHVASHLAHSHRRLDAACHSIYPAGQSEEVEGFALLADSIGGVDLGTLIVPLLKRLGMSARVQCKSLLRTFFKRAFSVFSSFCAFFDCLVKAFAVNYWQANQLAIDVMYSLQPDLQLEKRLW